MSKRQKGVKVKKIDALWNRAFELDLHVLELVDDVAERLSEGKMIHPESELAIHLVGAVDERHEAIDAAIEAEEEK